MTAQRTSPTDDQDLLPDSNRQRAPAPDSPSTPHPKHRPAPAQERKKDDAPSFPPGSPENVPAGPTSA